MAKEAGFTVDGEFYPFAGQFRMGDPVLVREVTGLRFAEFADRLGQMQATGDVDPDVLAGMVAVAIWQRNPRWSRDKVRSFVEQMSMDDFTPVAGDDDDPPAEAANPSPGSSAESTSTPEPSAEQDQS